MRVIWKGELETLFGNEPADQITRLRYIAGAYLEAVSGAVPDIEHELREWALEELFSARDMADNMLANSKEEIVAQGATLLAEIKQEIGMVI
ncbi:MAG TPA: hypothetical protein VJI73_03275 [Candidatus Paceibacterota bacterium]